ncbi:cysteine and glycine-rich protein 1-like [Zophobas morio]|jgi:cysteine/glycine-rich protein|uniref:cysteine and glycine-rich protein 1-like n=1 Tax=Zophobas morio TaxID=2755281 RepID=UPI003083846F
MTVCVKCHDEIEGPELEGHHLACAECYVCYGGFKDGGCKKDHEGRLLHENCMPKLTCASCGGGLIGEMLSFEGKDYHKKCLCCSNCQNSLSGVPFGRTSNGELSCRDCLEKTSTKKEAHEEETKSKPYGQYTRCVKPVTMKSGDCGVCSRCNKKVYAAERIHGPEKTTWHKGCFKCKNCSCALEAGKESTKNKEIYCTKCYTANFGPKGYGYGVGAGALVNTGKTAEKGSS